MITKKVYQLHGLCPTGDKVVVINILQAIKEVCGSLKPSWFMSDMAPQYFSAWKKCLDKTLLNEY